MIKNYIGWNHPDKYITPNPFYGFIASWWIMPYINMSMKRAVAELIREAMDNARNSI